MHNDLQIEIIQRLTRVETKIDEALGDRGRIAAVEKRVEHIEAARETRNGKSVNRAIRWAAYVGLAVGGYFARHKP